MNSMFYECRSLSSLPDISKWNTDNVTNMNFLFYNCNSLFSLSDISKWKNSNFEKINYGCFNVLNTPNFPF